MVLYNVHGRTVADLNNETTLRLAAIPHIVVASRMPTGNIERRTVLIQRAVAQVITHTHTHTHTLEK